MNPTTRPIPRVEGFADRDEDSRFSSLRPSARRAAVVTCSPQYEVQINLANTQLRGDLPEPAIVSAEAALHINKDSPAAYYIRACSNLRLGRAAEAVKDFQQSIRLDPKVGAAHFQLGHAYLALAQNAEAAAAFRETTKLEPEHRAAYYGLSQALTRLGQAEDAAKALARHQELTAGQLSSLNSSTFFEKCAHTEPLLPAVEAEEPAADGIKVAFVDATADCFGGKTFRGRRGSSTRSRNSSTG